jgi:hypothetical protein
LYRRLGGPHGRSIIIIIIIIIIPIIRRKTENIRISTTGYFPFFYTLLTELQATVRT